MNVAALRLVLGDQLSFDLSALEGLDPARDRVLLAEVAEEAGHVPHHPQKLAFLFSAMRHFGEALRQRGVAVDYVALDDPDSSGSLVGELTRFAAQHRPAEIHVTEAGDWRVEQALKSSGLQITWHADRRFFCSRGQFARWARGKKQLRMELFYREMRRQADLLLHADGTPQGGVWNLDADNRKPLPRGLHGPMTLRFAADSITRDVLALVKARFAHHYGSLDGFDYPVTHAEAEQLWLHFLDFGLAAFGDYQDAMASGEPFLFHARIGAVLNVGCLTCADCAGTWRWLIGKGESR